MIIVWYTEKVVRQIHPLLVLVGFTFLIFLLIVLFFVFLPIPTIMAPKCCTWMVGTSAPRSGKNRFRFSGRSLLSYSSDTPEVVHSIMSTELPVLVTEIIHDYLHYLKVNTRKVLLNTSQSVPSKFLHLHSSWSLSHPIRHYTCETEKKQNMQVVK
jgi:hypothetical protein